MNTHERPRSLPSASRAATALALAAALVPGLALAHSAKLGKNGCHWGGVPKRYHCHTGEFQSRTFEKKSEMRAERRERDHPRKDSDPSLAGYEVRVVRVADGDTIHVMINGQVEKVRYLGVEAPEVSHPDWADADMWRAARLVNSKLVLGKRVNLEFDPQQQRDGHGRLLAYVWADGVMVNAEMVRLGYAQAKKDASLKHWELFARLQDEAREEKRGLWSRLDHETLEVKRRKREREKEREVETARKMTPPAPDQPQPAAEREAASSPTESPSADQ